MKTLYLMRHGQTRFNKRRKIQGACDSPLTPLGIAQGKAAAELLKDVSFDTAYCSTAERASDTLELVLSGRDMSYTRLKGIKEMDFGMYEGESEDLHPTDLNTFFDFYSQYGGERAEEVAIRMDQTLHEMMDAQEEGSTVLAVTHGGAMMCFYTLLGYQPDMNKQFPNCAIMKLSYENGAFSLLEILDPAKGVKEAEL